MNINQSLLLKVKKEILVYLISRIMLIWIIIKYLNSASFLDDIHIMYFFGTHPLCLITGSYIEGASAFFGAYAPLEPLIYAPFTVIINGINSIRFATFTFEFLTLLMMIIIGNRIIKEDTIHGTIFVYIIIPLSWVESIIWAQDEILASLFLLIFLYLYLENRESSAAFLLGLTCISSKIIPLILLIPMLLTFKNKIRSLIFTMFPIIAILIPINLRYRELGLKNPFLLQIVNGGYDALTLPNLIRLISGLHIEWGILAFAFLSTSFVIYYSYLIYKYRQRDLPNFIDMIIVSFLIYFVFFFAAIHPEHYLFILPILLLRLAMLHKLDRKEIILLFALSISSITWKVLAMLNFLSQNLTYVQGSSLPIRILEAHDELIGNRFFNLEEILLISITLSIIIRYIIIFLKFKTDADAIVKDD